MSFAPEPVRTVPCPDCGDHVSIRASQCPSCGAPLDQLKMKIQGRRMDMREKNLYKRNMRALKAFLWLVFLSGGVFLVLILYYVSAPKTSESSRVSRYARRRPRVAEEEAIEAVGQRNLPRNPVPAEEPAEKAAAEKAAAEKAAAEKAAAEKAAAEKAAAEKAAAEKAATERKAALEKLGVKIRKDDEGNIVSLNFNSTKIADADLVHLKGLAKLQNLTLSYTKITDAGLVHLRGLANLEVLTLLETQVTDAGVADLQKALPDCEILH